MIGFLQGLNRNVKWGMKSSVAMGAGPKLASQKVVVINTAFYLGSFGCLSFASQVHEANAENEQEKMGELYSEVEQDLKFARPAEQKQGVSGRIHGWYSSQVGLGLKGGWPFSASDNDMKSDRADASENDMIMRPAEQGGVMASSISDMEGSSGKEVMDKISDLLEECIARVSSFELHITRAGAHILHLNIKLVGKICENKTNGFVDDP